MDNFIFGSFTDLDPRVAEWLRIQGAPPGMDRLNARRSFLAQNPGLSMQTPAEEAAARQRLRGLLEATGNQPTTAALAATGARYGPEAFAERQRQEEEASRLRGVGQAKWAAGRQNEGPVAFGGRMSGNAGTYVAPEAGRGGNLFAGTASVTPEDYARYMSPATLTTTGTGAAARFSDIFGKKNAPAAAAAMADREQAERDRYMKEGSSVTFYPEATKPAEPAAVQADRAKRQAEWQKSMTAVNGIADYIDTLPEDASWEDLVKDPGMGALVDSISQERRPAAIAAMRRYIVYPPSMRDRNIMLEAVGGDPAVEGAVGKAAVGSSPPAPAPSPTPAPTRTPEQAKRVAEAKGDIDPRTPEQAKALLDKALQLGKLTRAEYDELVAYNDSRR